jgi:N-acetylglucosamine malate deacetylase 2
LVTSRASMVTWPASSPGEIDLCVRVDRARQRRAALMHVTQAAPTSVLWRRLQLQADREHLRWLVPPR